MMKGIDYTARAPTLTAFSLRWCAELTDVSFAALSSCSQLRFLDISFCPQAAMTDAAFVSNGTARLSSLTELRMNSCIQHTITDGTFGRWRRCRGWQFST
jgi:hypothetical protein